MFSLVALIITSYKDQLSPGDKARRGKHTPREEETSTAEPTQSPPPPPVEEKLAGGSGGGGFANEVRSLTPGTESHRSSREMA